YRACQDLGIECPTEKWSGLESPIRFVVRQNLLRLHMSEIQRALVGARIKPLFEEEARQRQERSRAKPGQKVGANMPPPLANGEAGKARDKAAETVKVSPRSVEDAGVILKSGIPELAKMVEEDKVSVNAASTVAHLPKPEQRNVVAQGPDAVT